MKRPRIPCPLCALPVNMDFPVLGPALYRHLNRIALRQTRRLLRDLYR